MTPREFILKMLEAACVDACDERTATGVSLRDFEEENEIEITDIRFNPSTGNFILELEGEEVREETLKLGLEVKVVKYRDSN